MIKYISIFAFLLMAAFATITCKHSPTVDATTGVTDKALFDLVTNSSLFYYQGNASYLASDPSSPHDKFMRVNFNAKALSALGPDGKLPQGSTFPDSSLIIKETSTTQAGSLKLYAVMYKMPKASNAGNGWVWAEYKPGGSVVFGAGNKGSNCISCHSAGKHRDLVRVFDLH